VRWAELLLGLRAKTEEGEISLFLFFSFVFFLFFSFVFLLFKSHFKSLF